MAGLYVHIPFCSSFCIYCDFYSELTKGKMDDYLEALSHEAAYRKDFLGVPPATVYVGGGTPSLLSDRQFGCLVEILGGTFDLSQAVEFTLEANPDDVTPEKLSLWRSCGVNRLSMGVQSFRDDHLRWMRRRHDAGEARKAFAMAREAGFDNISIDLIFGFSSLDEAVWDDNISEVIRLHPEHISCYQMMLEPGSRLSELAAEGKYIEPAQDLCSRQYALLCKRLADAGYGQYEVSNFALPGKASRHNSSYWVREPYLGLGPAAHSFDGGHNRSWNNPDLEAYLNAFRTEIPNVEGYCCGETLSDRDVFNEIVMLSLRTAAGLDTAELQSSYPLLFEETAPAFAKAVSNGNLVKTTSGNLRIPSDLLFISDGIIGNLFR